MDNLSPYTFEKSPLWDDIIGRLTVTIESEISEAMAQAVTSEVRSHQCGRAEALMDFKNTLEHLRNSAKK